MQYENEIWKDIEGYEGLYQVSDQGIIRSLGNDKSRKEKVLKARNTGRGYLQVVLYKNGKPKRSTVHRLVATAFIPNPDSLPQVNHKDENKKNNCVDNLEWCDYVYNNNYGTRNQRVAEKFSKRVAQYTLDGALVAIYANTMEVERQTGFLQSHISKCRVGKQKTAYGYIWKYID